MEPYTMTVLTRDGSKYETAGPLVPRLSNGGIPGAECYWYLVFLSGGKTVTVEMGDISAVWVTSEMKPSGG